MTGPLVVKLGGSLLDWPGFPGALSAALHSLGPTPVVLVVGGGKVADVVRTLDSALGIGELRSHGLALRALDLTAEVVAAVVPGLTVVESADQLAGVWSAGRTPVLAPRRFMEEVDRPSADPLPATWAVTTDSIAARLAGRLGAAGLLLLKSTAPGADQTLQDAADSGLVDPYFPAAARPIPWVRVRNLRETPIRVCSLV